MNIIAELEKHNITLPEAPLPGGNYEAVNLRGKMAFIAIQLPKKGGEFLFQGKLGAELSSADGYKAAELCALNILAQINKHLNLNAIEGLNHLDIYYQAANDWDDAPNVANGASDLFHKILGEKGKHTRAIFGVERLPRNMCVGITATFTMK